MRKKLFRGRVKRVVAATLAGLMLNMSVLPYLPGNLTAHAFGLIFVPSGTPASPYLYGQVDGEEFKSWFLCLNHGAPANSQMDYSKINADVDYANGTLDQKKLFWAYIGTWGSYDGDPTVEMYKNSVRPDQAKKVAWKEQENAWVNQKIDEFAMLDNVPEGAKSAKEILDTVMTYNTPETPILLGELQAGPGEMSKEKLYEKAGVKSWEYFRQYCSFEALPYEHGGKTWKPVIREGEYSLYIDILDENGLTPAVGETKDHPPAIVKVIYDPSIFKVREVSGRIEYFKATNWSGAQQLARVKGHVEEYSPVFYISSKPGPFRPDSGGGGGHLDDGDGIEVEIFRHEETFESNYHVDLTKKDYETGHPLQSATWQVLEAFPDQTKLSSSEEDGELVEDNMREAPTTWDNWLIFQDDMKTNEDGYIKHSDKRFYDFNQTYCNGHPEPPEPDPPAGDDPESQADYDAAMAEYEALMAEWQAAVDECEGIAESSNGTHHHWVKGGTTAGSEAESFESSGCKAVRDKAYENFINLRYSYTFREVEARNGYIIHGQNGHPDDVPIEIITTASSEAGKPYEWTQCSNEDIIVEGYARDYLSGDSDEEGEDSGDGEDETGIAKTLINSISGQRMVKRAASGSNATDSIAASRNPYLPEKYDLSFGEKAIRALRQFIGLPTEDSELTIHVVAEYDEVYDPELEEELRKEEALEEELENDLDTGLDKNETLDKEEDSDSGDATDTATSSNAGKNRKAEISVKKRSLLKASLTHSSEESSDKTSDGAEIPVATPSEPQKDGEISDESTPNKKPKTVQGFRKAPFTDAGDEAPLLSSGRSGGYIDLDSATTDSQPEAEPGKSDTMLHSWIVYDHRVPGQIHINKKDMELAEGENVAYSAYGDTQGDATLEGAVYGLFAADPIYGPDTQRNEDGSVKKGTGLLFDANDLVAVATTDKNGDASFLTITEKPHSIYNYETGQIEYTGKPYPKNLYDLDGYRKEYENEETGRIYKNNYETNGDHWIGRPLILGNYYIKELTRSEGYELSITGKDMEFTNATEENRGDYGSTEDSKSHPVGTAWIEQKLSHAVTFPEANPQYGNRENLLSVEIRSNGTTNGFDVVFDGIPEGADFYFDNVKTSNVTVQVPVGGQWVDATEEPLYETAKDGTVSKRDKDGNQILNPDAVKDFPVIYNGYGYEAKTVTGDSAEPEDKASYGAAFTSDDANFRYVKYELEQMLRQIGVTTPYDEGSYSRPDFPVYDEPVDGAYGMPEFTITVNNVTTNKSLIDAVLDYFASKEVYTYGSLQDVALNGNTATVRVAVGMNPKKTLLYKKNAAGDVTNAYLFKLNEVTGRYVMREYSGDGIIATELPGNSGKYQLGLRPDFTINENGMPENVYTYRPGTEFLKYQTGDVIYDYWYQDAGGNWVGHEPVRRRVYQTIYEEQVVEQTDVSSSKVAVVGSREEVKDPIGSTYVYYDEVSKQYILHAGAKDAELSGEKTSGFTIALPNGTRTLTDADIEKIGSNNVWGYKVGQKVQLSEYLVRIQGAGAGVHTAPDFDKDTSYIKNQRLIYNGNHNLSEDGNTDQTPNPVKERIITEEIKVTKTIQGTSYNNTNSYGDVHEDWFTETFGGLLGRKEEALKMDNFRFKTYLKSNLEGLYRDNDGNVVWLDRTGKEVDQLKANANFPALVNKIYTKVPHKTAPLYKDSDDAIIANEALYSYKDGLINANQNAGYTAVLETITMEMEDGAKTRTIEALNYDKFFDAIAVANNDKWDDAAPTYTSWKPIGNQANRNENAIENARVSDMVRQFAIDWYLDDEIKKLVRPVPENNAETEDADGKVDYSDELYDEALRAAIIKAENYLKPFFAYDLDEIYAVAWDSEEDGGKDKDLTTLSADTLHGEEDNTSEGYYYGTSLRLPYGTYVVVEQQPRYANLEDFKNRHYQIDKPKEVGLPSVYADYEGSQQSPEVTNDYYNYSSTLSQPEMERRYKIRFNEEALHVIKGRNSHGDFEVYKYGMDMDRIRNGVTGTGKGDYFALTQSEFKPYKNYYNLQDDRTTGDVPYYLTEGLSGREKVSKYYRYSSVAENKGTADVVTMQGAAIAYEGKYAPMLVPWSIVVPENAATEEKETQVQATGESSYKGYAYTKLRNRFFTSKLRIEKLDSETHENILHDGAIFNIYAAKRDDSPDGEGRVLFYEKPTTIIGTREFLESMGAEQIQPLRRQVSWLEKQMEKITGNALEEPEYWFSGMVPAGTPVCDEAEQIVLRDKQGIQTGAFQSYSTVLDGFMKKDTGEERAWQLQTVGYLETPQPLGAGVYVLCEQKPPTGYARSKPVALEVYSDQISYYKNGNRDERVAAAVYEYEADHQTEHGTKSQDTVLAARIHVENGPIQLQVEKVKETAKGAGQSETDRTVTYCINGRIDGSLFQIGGNSDYEYAYENGRYAGYAWKKGTLEHLAARKAAGEQVEIVYEGSLFAGYGYVTRPLETADDENMYVSGALMTLFDALELKPSGDTEDHAYQGLVVERDGASNVIRMYVEEGAAGSRIDFVKEPYETENQLTGADSVWTARRIQRPDTDILYYDLGGLDILTEVEADGQKILCGYDRNHRKVQLSQTESERRNQKKTDREHGLFAFRDSVPCLEITGGDFTKLRYSAADKVITAAEGTRIYHLDRDGNRDALVDPYTGMAYVEAADGSVMVWPVNIRRDADGNIIARDKIRTSRIAAVGEAEQEETYLTGSWKSEQGEESHRESSLVQNENGQNQNEEALTADNNGSFEKGMNPVYDGHGLPVYYQQSEEIYDKSADLYDRDGDFVRQQDSDYLKVYNEAAYRINDQKELEDGDALQEGQVRRPLYHRQGESYILENTWITSEKTPNDPFHTQMTDGQPDLLKRVPVGCYIMEELKSPDGYGKGLPVGIKVAETEKLQKTVMEDRTTKIEIVKTDSPAYAENDSDREPKLAFSYEGIPGATLALFPARRVYTNDTIRYPSGYYLEKTSQEPLRYHSTESTESNPKILTAKWTTTGAAIYLEGIPRGDYLLEELETPEGYVTSRPVEVVITGGPEVQVFEMADDHTRIEIEKYTMDGRDRKPVEGAGFTLYQARVDERGEPVYEDGVVSYQKDAPIASWVTGNGSVYQDFIPVFEEMYCEYGTTPETSVSWDSGGVRYRAEQIFCKQIDASVDGGRTSIWPTSAVMMFQMEDGRIIRIGIYGERNGPEGRDFSFEYQFDYQRLPKVNQMANQYQTVEGRQRLEYLPAGSWYALVETTVPEGFAAAEPIAVYVKDQAEVQHYQAENVAARLMISKTVKGRGNGELAGAHLGLYRPGKTGELVQDEEHLITRWVTGEDGEYSELDYINGRIPTGYNIGDLRPHTIQGLPEGVYWLAEIKSPAYYTAFEPVRIEHSMEQMIQVIRAEDTPAVGTLTIKKREKGGKLLPEAEFELRAYEQEKPGEPVLTKTLQTEEGVICAEDLPVGKILSDGQIEPYIYKLVETVPPDGYAVNTRIFSWKFELDKNGVSYVTGEPAQQEITVEDEKTRVIINKTLFGEAGTGADMFVEGAVLAVFPVTGYDSQGQLRYDADDLRDRWVTSGNQPDHVVEGLTAGQSYVLVEEQAPPGYHIMKPLVFTLSADGRSIASVGSGLNRVMIHFGEEKEENHVFQKIEGITVRGRSPIRSVLKRSGKDMLVEQTFYSDGTDLVTRRIIQDEAFVENSRNSLNRKPERTELSVETVDGRVMGSFHPQPRDLELTISNEKELFEYGETYIVREHTVWSDGSRMESDRFSFGLDEAGAVCRILAADQKTRVEIQKLDKETGEALAGAGFQLLDSLGNLVADWVSDGKPWRLKGILLAGETYILREISAPAGYQTMNDQIFTVPESMELLTVVCRNIRIPEEPGEPEEPDEPEPPDEIFRIGTITVSYKPGQPRAAGWLYLGRDGKIRIPLPGTGQSSEGWWYGAGFLLSLSLLLGMSLCRKKKKE